MKTYIAVMSALMLVGCAAAPLADPASLRKYDDISACAHDAEKNPVRANCRERFKDTELRGELNEFSFATGDNPYLRLAIRGHDSINCELTGAQDRNLLAMLDPGLLVTVRGTPAERAWDTIVLRPCALISAGTRPPPLNR